MNRVKSRGIYMNAGYFSMLGLKVGRKENVFDFAL